MKKLLSLTLILSIIIGALSVPFAVSAKMTDTAPAGFSQIVVNNGDNLATDGAKLNDGYYLSARERTKLKTKTRANYETFYVNFDEAGEGFDIEFSSPNSSVTRLDIWMRRANSIADYRIISYDSEGNPTVIKDDCLLADLATDSKTNINTYTTLNDSAFYPTMFRSILFDAPIQNCSRLSFIIDSYGPDKEATGIAEISEVSLAEGLKNGNYIEPNLTYTIMNSASGDTKGVFVHTTDGSTEWYGRLKNSLARAASPYALGHHMSANTEGYDVAGDSWAQYSTKGFAWAGHYSNENLTNLKPDSSGLCYYSVDLGPQKHIINHITIPVAEGNLTGVEVFSANDANAYNTTASVSQKDVHSDTNHESWQSLGKFECDASAGETVSFSIPSAEPARFWMLKFDCNADLQIPNTLGLYAVPKMSDYMSGLSLAADKALSEMLGADELWAYDLNLQSEVDGCNISYTTDSEYIDIDGTTASFDIVPSPTEAVIKASAEDSEGNTITLSRTITLGMTDGRAKTVVINNSFDNETDAVLTGDADISDGTLTMGTGSAEIDLSLNEGFKYNGTALYELKLADDTADGEISFKAGNTKLINLAFSDKELTASCNGTNTAIDFTGRNGILIEKTGNKFNLFVLTDASKSIKIYEGTLSADKTIDNISASAEGGNIEIENISVTAVDEELIRDLEGQFNFDKIANGQKAVNITSKLNLFSNIGEADGIFSYTLLRGTRLNAETGDVTGGDREFVQLKVKGEISGQTPFEKSFDMYLAPESLFANSTVTSSVAADFGTDRRMVVDGSTDASFTVTDAEEFTLTIDLEENKDFNRVVFFPAYSGSPANGVKISVSNDNSSYTDVYTSASVAYPIDNAEFAKQNARYIRITTTQTKDAAVTNGYKEILAYLELTDREKCEYDVKNIMNTANFENSGSIAKVGSFGSNITVTSSNTGIINVTNNNSTGKWDISVTAPQSETEVTVTVTATLGQGTATDTKTVLFLGGNNLSGNKPSLGGNNGGGNGGGGNNGGSIVAPPINIPDYPSVQNPSQQSPSYNTELNGHWGQKEIEFLMDEKIVQGNGESLELDKNITRAEFVKMIIEAFDFDVKEYSGSFSDVDSGVWYAKYAQTAINEGLMSGDGVNFRGDDPITREEMCVVLTNLFKKQGLSLDTDSSTSFADSYEISSWADEAVSFMAKTGLVNGYPTGEFLPLNSLRRDEAMVVIYRAIELDAE